MKIPNQTKCEIFYAHLMYFRDVSAFKMIYIVSGAVLNSTHYWFMCDRSSWDSEIQWMKTISFSPESRIVEKLHLIWVAYYFRATLQSCDMCQIVILVTNASVVVLFAIQTSRCMCSSVRNSGSVTFFNAFWCISSTVCVFLWGGRGDLYLRLPPKTLYPVPAALCFLHSFSNHPSLRWSEALAVYVLKSDGWVSTESGVNTCA